MSDAWPATALGTLVERMTTKNSEGNGNVLTISARHGLVSQRDYFNKTVASDNLSNYYLLRKGDFAYNKSYSDGYPVGAIKRLDQYESGVVSPLYICFRLRQTDQVVSDFLVHCFESGLLDAGIRAIAKEGARNHGLLNVKVSDFFELPIPLPRLHEQRKIAAILSAVDAAIEATQAVIDQLQVVKKAMMDELLTRGLPGRHTRSKQTEIGEVPEAWHVVSLGDLAAFVTSGSRGWAQYYATEGALFIRSQNVRDGHLDLSDRVFVRPPHGAEGARTRLLADDVLVTITGNSVGNVALAPHGIGEAYISQHVGLIRLKEPTTAKFVATYLSPGAPGNGQVLAAQYGQSKPGLNLTNLRSFWIAMPGAEERDSIQNIIEAHAGRIETEVETLRQAHEVKAALMSVLLTGEVRVTADEAAA